MSASGEMGTLNPPSDKDDVAKVTPLRRRDAHLVAVPTVRDPLPAETSVWDTDEPGEPRLRRTNRRRVRSALTIGWRAVRARVRVPPRVVLGAGVALACLAAVAVFALGFASKSVTRTHRTVASSLVTDSSSSGNLPTPAASSAHRAPQSTHRPTGHRTSGRAATIQHRLTRVASRRVVGNKTTAHRPTHAVRKKSTVHHPNTAKSVQSTAMTSPPAPSTPVTTPTSSPSTSTTAAATSGPSNATVASPPTGPSGAGAAFGPGY